LIWGFISFLDTGYGDVHRDGGKGSFQKKDLAKRHHREKKKEGHAERGSEVSSVKGNVPHTLTVSIRGKKVSRFEQGRGNTRKSRSLKQEGS